MNDDIRRYLEVLDPHKANLPLLLLDIDGVLNAYQYRPAETETKRGDYTDLNEYSIGTDIGRTFRFWTSPTLIAEINDLHNSGKVEIAWLTTWTHQANRHVSPALGLPYLPVFADCGGRLSDYHWKSRAAVDAAQLGRPIIWIDDAEITPHDRATYRTTGTPHLLIAPDAERGLTRTDMEKVRAFIEQHAP